VAGATTAADVAAGCHCARESMNDYNSGIAARLVSAIQDFESGSLTLGEMQAVLEAAAALLENDESAVTELVRVAAADVEEIRFTVFLDEQRPAAIFRLDELRSALEMAADG
jgi:hypothetical protein